MTADAFDAFATRDYETLVGDSYADPLLELEYLRNVVGQHIAHSFRVEAENTKLRLAARPEYVADLVAARVREHAAEYIRKLLADAAEGINKSLLPRIERITHAQAELKRLEARQLELDARARLLAGELNLLGRIENREAACFTA